MKYAEQLVRQNSGLPCIYCGSLSGHTYKCATVNRGVEAEPHSIAVYSKEDRDFLRAFGIAGEDSRGFGIDKK